MRRKCAKHIQRQTKVIVLNHLSRAARDFRQISNEIGVDFGNFQTIYFVDYSAK